MDEGCPIKNDALSKGIKRRYAANDVCTVCTYIYIHTIPLLSEAGSPIIGSKMRRKCLGGALGIEGTAMWDDVARMMLYQRYR